MQLGGKYRLGERIGAGGMGEVYSAVQRDLDRVVAVKVLHPDMRTDPVALRRFKVEATVASRIQHPNVIAVIDFGHADDGSPFLVLEHVRGQSMPILLATEGTLDVRRAARLVADVLAGLAEAHAEGIVHADVKTDNVIVERYRDGTEIGKLLDFGLARFVDDPPETEGGAPVIFGTPEFLAPEVIRGIPATPSADIYATGIMLYELLTGATPFKRSSISATLCAHIDEDVIPPSKANRRRYIPAAMDAVIQRALAKEPTDRFATADEFKKALLAAMPAEAPITPVEADVFTSDPTRREPIRPHLRDLLREAAAVPTPKREGAIRAELGEAIARGDREMMITGYLDLARVLVTAKRLMPAANELEEAIDLITLGAGPTSVTAPESLWRLLLALASIYAGLGDRPRGLELVKLAKSHARRNGSQDGCERADAMDARLRARR